MNTHFKRIVSAICALALCASMIPASALAETPASSSSSAVVQQAEEENTSVSSTVTSDADADSSASSDAQSTETDTTSGTDEVTGSEATPVPSPDATATPAPEATATPAPEATATPAPEGQEGEDEASDSQPNAVPNALPEAAGVMTMDAGEASTYAHYNATISVSVGESIPYDGAGWWGIDHDWEVTYGTGVASVQGNGSSATVTGKQEGTAVITHTYYYWGYRTERILVNVTKKASSAEEVYLFIAKPGNTTLSNDGDDYYYLAHGGLSSSLATHSSFAKDTTNETSVKQYVSEWPTTLDFITGTSSTSVSRGSTWEINSATGEVTSFDLILGNQHYTSDDYGLRWAKFSYASTGGKGNHYHVDAILYDKVKVQKVIDTLNISKQVTDYALDSNHQEMTGATFNFEIVDLNDDYTPKGDVKIPLTVTVNGKTATKLNAGDQADTVLAPGHYMVCETQSDADLKAWNTANAVYFDVNTDGSIVLVESKSTTSTITNSAKTYTLTYYLKGGSGTFAQVNGLKYNAEYQIAGTEPTKEGNVFLGWSLNSDDNTVELQAGDTVTIEDHTTLYAVWAPVSVTKSVVLSGMTVPAGITKGDYATVVSRDGEYFTYTASGATKILYKITVNAYNGAEVTLTDTPKNGTLEYVTAVNATTQDNTTFTLTDKTAEIYYAVNVTGVTDTKVVGNTASWTIDTEEGTTSDKDVTVVKTDNSVKITKTIKSITRGDAALQNVSESTVLYVGDVVTYQIVVENTGKATIKDIKVTDEFAGAGTLPTTATVKVGNDEPTSAALTWTETEDGTYQATLTIDELAYDIESDTAESATIEYSYTVVEGDKTENGNKLTNVASVEGADTDKDSDDDTEQTVEVPALTVVKEGTVGVSEDGVMQIHYVVTVTNTGNADFSKVELTDAKFPADVTVKIDNTAVDTSKVSLSGSKLTVQESAQDKTLLAVGKAMTVEYDYVVNDDDTVTEDDGSTTVTNTVDVTATSTTGATAEGDDEEKTTVYAGAVTLTLANIVIYTGGEGGSQAIIGDDGQPVDSDEYTGLPTFGVTMTLPNESPVTVDQEVKLYDVTSDEGPRANYEWSAIPYNNNATVLMQLTPEEGTEPVRIQLKDGENVVTSDEFSLNDGLFQTYTTELYVKEEGSTEIVAKIGDQFYTVSYENKDGSDSYLTVRGTTKDAEEHNVVTDLSGVDTKLDVPQAILPTGTEYRYVSGNGNNSGTLLVGDTSSVSLLVDEIVNQEDITQQEYVQMMKDKVEKDGGVLGAVPADTTRTWRFYYLDLVLANNGNAVLTTDSDVTICWPYTNTGLTYADVANGTYKVKVVHYLDLNRNYTGNFSAELEACEAKVYDVQATEQGLVFTVPADDGFSPFALVWERTTKTTTPTTPGGDNNNDTTTTTATATATPSPASTPAPAAAAVIPQTGDSMPVALLGGVAAVAAAAFVALTILRRRRKQ